MINRALVVMNGLLLIAVITRCASTRIAKPASMTLSELNIVDDKGIVRVRISGDLPDAVIHGKRVPRGSRVGGVMLYDQTGQERGGYLTETPSDNIFLTLDGKERQHVLFVTEPDGSTALRIQHGADAVELRADVDGARFAGIRAKKLVFQQPPFEHPEKTTTCAAYRDLRGKFSLAELLGYCSERLPEDACRVCLGEP